MIGWRIVALIVACGLLGCVEDIDRTGSPGWTRPDGSYAAFQKDTDECRHAASMRPTTFSGPAGRASEIRMYYNDCMTGRGWTLDTHVSKDLMHETVNCKLPDVEQVQRILARDCHNRFGKIL